MSAPGPVYDLFTTEPHDIKVVYWYTFQCSRPCDIQHAVRKDGEVIGRLSATLVHIDDEAEQYNVKIANGDIVQVPFGDLRVYGVPTVPDNKTPNKATRIEKEI